MGFTNAQFRWIAEKTGEVGLFAIVVGWEHIMLLIKYVMQTSTPKVPREVKDALRKEQYTSHRRRNLSMRAKQDRRSIRYFLSPRGEGCNSNISRMQGKRMLRTVFSNDASDASPSTPISIKLRSQHKPIQLVSNINDDLRDVKSNQFKLNRKENIPKEKPHNNTTAILTPSNLDRKMRAIAKHQSNKQGIPRIPKNPKDTYISSKSEPIIVSSSDEGRVDRISDKENLFSC